MKKRKFLLLIISVFLLSGCSAEYNLTINEDTMEEDINAIFDKARESEYASNMEQIRRTAYYNFDTRENEYYTFKKDEDENNIILNYKYRYTDNNLYKSEAFSRCYYKRIVNVTDDYITISTDNQVACLYKDGEKEIDNITVNIRTNLKVEENNADEVNGNIYTWYINDQNYTDKPINIKIKKERVTTPIEIGLVPTIFIIIIVIILIIFTTFVVITKNKKNNNLK